MRDPLKYMPAAPEALQAGGRLQRLAAARVLTELLVWRMTTQQLASPAKAGHTIAEAR